MRPYASVVTAGHDRKASTNCMPLAKANPFEAFLKGTEQVVQLTIGGTEKLLKQSGDEIGKIFSGGTHMNDDGSPPGTPKATRPELRGDYRGGFSRSGSSSPSSYAASCSPLPTVARPCGGQSHPTPISSSCASTRQSSPTAELEAAHAPSLPPRMKSRQWAAEPPLWRPRTDEIAVDGSREGSSSTRGPKSEPEHTPAAADALEPERAAASASSAVEGPRVESRESREIPTSPMIDDEEEDGDLNPDVPLRPRSADIKAEIASLRRQQEHHAVHGERAVEGSEQGGENPDSSYSVTAEHLDVRSGATLDAKEKASPYSARLDRAKRANYDRRASMEIVELALELERPPETRQSLIRNSQSEAHERERQLQMAQRHLEAAQAVQRRYESPAWDESAADWEFLIRESPPSGASVLRARIQAYEHLSSRSPPRSPPRPPPRASPRLTPRSFASPQPSIEADWEFYGQGTPVALLAQLRAKSRGAIVRLVRRKLAHGWRTWVSFAVTHAPSLRLIRTGVTFWTHRTLALGLAKWSKALALMRALRTARPLSKALSYCLKRELARGWVGWLTRCAVLRATRGTMRMGLLRLNHRGLSRGWGAWLEMTMERRHERVEALRLLRKGVALDTALQNRQMELDTALSRALSPSRVALDALAFDEVEAPATPKLMLSLAPIVESQSLESLESLVDEDEVRARRLWEVEGALDEAKWDVRRGRGVPLLSPELRDAEWDDECIALSDTLWEVESSSMTSSSKPRGMLKAESSMGMNEPSTSYEMSPRSPPVSMTSLPAFLGSPLIGSSVSYSQPTEGRPGACSSSATPFLIAPAAHTALAVVTSVAVEAEAAEKSVLKAPPVVAVVTAAVVTAEAEEEAAVLEAGAGLEAEVEAAVAVEAAEERQWSASHSPTRSPMRTRSAPLPTRGPPSPSPLPQPVLTRAARRNLLIAVLGLVMAGGGAVMMQTLNFVNLARMAQSLVADGWAQIMPPLMSINLLGFDLHASAHHGAASPGLLGFDQMEMEAIAFGAISTRPRAISTGPRSSNELAATSAILPNWHLCASRACGRPVVRRPPPSPPPYSLPSVPLPPPPPPPPPPAPLLQLVCASLLLVTVFAAAWARKMKPKTKRSLPSGIPPTTAPSMTKPKTKPSLPGGAPPTTAPFPWPHPPSAKNGWAASGSGVPPVVPVGGPATEVPSWATRERIDSACDSNGCDGNGSDCNECDGMSIADIEAEVLAAEAAAAEAVARAELPLAAEEICPKVPAPAPALVAHTLAPAPAYPPAAAPAAAAPAPPQLFDTALDLALTTTPPELLRAFAVATAALSHASAGKHLFLRVAAHDPSVTALELSHDPEIARWPLERQAAALGLLQASPHVTKLNLSGLNLTDAVAPALRAVLEAPISRLEVLSLEQNDFREAGLLELVEGLRTNTALRELRLDGQKMPTSKRVEEVLADKFETLESFGATRLSKLGLSFREDAARRRVDGALFRVADRLRIERTLLGSLGRGVLDSSVPNDPDDRLRIEC